MSPALMNLLGVLRAPRTQRDRPPSSAVARINGAQLKATRYVGTDPLGRRHFIVPIRHGSGVEDPLPDACVAALKGEARRVAERRNERIRQARGGRPRWDVCFISETGSGGCGLGGARAIAAVGTVITSDGGTQPTTQVVGLVPDGVAAVIAEYRDGSRKTVPVARNFFSFEVAAPAPRAAPTLYWLNGDGQQIRTVRR